MNRSNFQRIAHAVARVADFELLEVYEPDVTPNFFAAGLYHARSQQKLYLLCSRDDASWAISEHFELSSHELRFVDCRAISQALTQVAGVAPLGAYELNGPFSAREHMLASDVKYWKPRTLGQGLFNWWD